LTLGIAFGIVVAGASFYLFLPDPSRSAPTSTKLSLSPSHFTPATIVSSESHGPDTKLLQLVVPPNLLPCYDASNSSFHPIWSVFIKDDDIQVERPYTPLEGIDEQGRLLFWIKKYPMGEVGRWLHSKAVGDQVELRGPLKTWSWKDDEWDEIIMVRG
jgi:cytochrome-b5 reductase